MMGKYCMSSQPFTECCQKCSGEIEYAKVTRKKLPPVTTSSKHSPLTTDSLGKKSDLRSHFASFKR